MEKRSRGSAGVRQILGMLAVTTLVVTGVIQPVGAHVGTGADHLWAGHISKMNDPGTINQNANPVHWTKLKGVPGGFADGKDRGVADTVGFGLRSAPVFNSPGKKVLRVRTDKVQRRITGTCAGQRAVNRVNEDGSVACTAIRPVAVEYSDEEVGSINSESFRSVGSLQLEAGVYAIWAKLAVWNHAQDEQMLVECQLVAGSFVDRAVAHEPETPDPCSTCGTRFIGANTLPMQLVAANSRPFKADVQCVDHQTAAEGFYLRIMAMPLNLDLEFDF